MTDRYISNTFYTGLSHLFQVLISIAVTPLIIHSLGKEQYGIIVTTAAVSVFGWLSLMDAGFQGAVTKMLADVFASSPENKNLSHDIIRMGLSFYLVCGMISGIFVYILSFYPSIFSNQASLHPLITSALIVVACFNALIFPILILQSIAESLQAYKFIRITNMIITTAWALGVIIVINTQRSILLFLVLLYLKSFFQYFVLLIVVKYSLPDLSLRPALPDVQKLRPLLHLSADLFVSRITGLVFNQTAALIIAIGLGNIAFTTDYSSANIIFTSILGIAAIFNATLISETAWVNVGNKREDIVFLAITGSRLTASFVLPMAVIVGIWAPEILTIWLGKDFEKNALLLRIILVAIVPIVATGATQTMLVGLNKLRGALWIQVVAVILNLTISITMLKQSGLLALGFGALVAYWVSGYLLSRYIVKILNVKYVSFYSDILKIPIAVSAAYFIIVSMMKQYVTPSSMYGIVLVLATSFLFCIYLIYIVSNPINREAIISVLGMQKIISAVRGR